MVEVELNQQQLELLRKLKERADYGETDEEIVRSIFRQWLEEEGLR